MAARVSLSSELPRDLPPEALISHGTFLINLEGEERPHVLTFVSNVNQPVLRKQ